MRKLHEKGGTNQGVRAEGGTWAADPALEGILK